MKGFETDCKSNMEFNIPSVIKDFIFDLHDAMRRSRRVDEVQKLYDCKLKEITDKYFSLTSWPDCEAIAGEVNNDETFLVFYREMTMRHVFTKLKPQVLDHVASWHNYVKLFETILNSCDGDICITTQWIYDITQEFVYQFQGFCQYRCQVASLSSNPDTIKVLEANRDVWNLPTVISILRRLEVAGKAAAKAIVQCNSPFVTQFGYFASIETARLECLMGDFSTSLAAISTITLNDRSELFMQLPLCHFNVFYHTGVCNLMLRKFSSAVDVFSDIILHVSRLLKPGANSNLRPGLQQQLQRMQDKVLALTAIACTLCPSYRIDDQVREAIESKFADKLQKLQKFDNFEKIVTELFEFASPKFISSAVPDYSIHLNAKQEAGNHILSIFLAEVQQHVGFLKLRSFLGLYATIDVSKMARFNDIPETDLICHLLSYKNKSSSSTSTDVHYFVDHGALVVDSGSLKSEQGKAHERFFIAGVRKHTEIMNQVNRVFSGLGIE